MLSNFDYLWKRLLCVCVCVCVNSTFGRCCHCCKKEETLYFKIDKAGLGEEDIKKCFKGSWYKACEGKVLLLKEAEEGDTDVLSVTGSGNKWTITDPQENKFKDDKCDSGKNKWIIVKVTTLQEGLEGAGDSFIFYVDEIESVDGTGVFEEIWCYSIEIIAANTRAAQDMYGMFYHVESGLEKDMGKDIVPGLIGLDKLNVENVTNLRWMFCMAIHKQATLEQLKKWRFSGKKSVCITNLFSSKVKGLNFSVLNGWSSAKKCGTVYFWQDSLSLEKVFVNDTKYIFTAPSWYNDIKDSE